MSPVRKQPPPYGLMFLGAALIILSTLFMLVRGVSMRGTAGLDALPYNESVMRDSMMETMPKNTVMFPILPGRGVPSGTERKVTKNASLELVVDQAEYAADAIALVANSYGGFVTARNLYEQGDTKTGTITVRVPSSDFEKALNEIKDIANEVRKETVVADDVTEQYVDLEARLKILDAQEKRYLAILKNAKTVEDTLKVTQYLNQVRSEIDQMSGQLEYLKNQVNMSSIEVTLLAEKDIEVFGIRWQPLLVLKESLRAMLDGIAGYVNAIIAIFFYLPVLLLWGATIFVVVYAGWKIIVKVKK